MLLSFAVGSFMGFVWSRKRSASLVFIPLVILIFVGVVVSWLSAYWLLPLSWPLWLSDKPPSNVIVIPEVRAFTLHFLSYPLMVKYYYFSIFPWHVVLEFFAWLVAINVPQGLFGFLIMTRKRIASVYNSHITCALELVFCGTKCSRKAV